MTQQQKVIMIIGFVAMLMNNCANADESTFVKWPSITAGAVVGAAAATYRVAPTAALFLANLTNPPVHELKGGLLIEYDLKDYAERFVRTAAVTPEEGEAMRNKAFQYLNRNIPLYPEFPPSSVENIYRYSHRERDFLEPMDRPAWFAHVDEGTTIYFGDPVLEKIANKMQDNLSFNELFAAVRTNADKLPSTGKRSLQANLKAALPENLAQIKKALMGKREAAAESSTLLRGERVEQSHYGSIEGTTARRYTPSPSIGEESVRDHMKLRESWEIASDKNRKTTPEETRAGATAPAATQETATAVSQAAEEGGGWLEGVRNSSIGRATGSLLRNRWVSPSDRRSCCSCYDSRSSR